MKRVAIIGGGIAGLTTALHLKDLSAAIPGGLEVVVLEAHDRVGGNIQTHRLDGFTIEGGPNGFLDSVPATLDLVDRLGLQSQIQKANERAARRFLFRNGQLHLLPTNPLKFFASPLLSWGGRLRILKEPLVPARRDPSDETIFDFGRRRIGPEATSVLIDAMVSGIFAGDIHQLSLASTFPKMAAMEAQYGSLVKAMFAKGKEKKAARKAMQTAKARGEAVPDLTKPGGPAGPQGTLTSFRDGLDTLPNALHKTLGDIVRLSHPVGAIQYQKGERPWRVTFSNHPPLDADAVVVALPSPSAIPLLTPLDPPLANAVREIPTAGLAVVALGFKAADLGDKLNGFGFLAPRSEGLRMLGCLWDSSIFPGRAPQDHALLRVMIGGAHDPEAMTLADDVLLDIVRRELATTMHLTATPVLSQVYRYPLGIGQYTLGHQRRLDTIHQRLATFPGLWVAGSAFYGVSMNACIEQAGKQVEEIKAMLLGR